MTKKLVVIDGKSVFYRGYYAMPNLATKDGTPTGGVFGFATMALEVLRRLKPDYVAVAWDKPKTNIRKRLEIYPGYKAGRKPAPPDFYDQIPVLHELLDAFGWPLYELDDYEADDIMGTFARQAGEQGIETLLVTSDMDLLQVVDKYTKVFALKKGLSNIELYSPESFTAKYGIEVSQFLDLKSLKGDSSDNIPGVPGVGEKTAVKLLQEYKTLDGVYENIELISGSTKTKLVAGKESAYMSKQLAAIWTDAPITLDLEATDGHHADPERIRDTLQKLEFRNLVRQLPDIMQIKIESGAEHNGNHLKLGVLPGNTIITDEAGLVLAAMQLTGSKQLIMHSRASGKHGQGAQLLMLSGGAANVFTIDLSHVKPAQLQKHLGSLLADAKLPKVGHDVKATMQVCYALGLDVAGLAHDTQIVAFALNALERDLSLTTLAEQVGYDGGSLDEMDATELTAAAPQIVCSIAAIAEAQRTLLAKLPKMEKLMQDIELPVIPVLAAMEYEGIKLDVDYMHTFAKQIDQSIGELSAEIFTHAGREFTIGSPAQLAEILFDDLQLPAKGIKKGKTGYSTAASELDKLRGLHPIINLVTNWREVTKLKNTYVDTLPLLVDANSRVHTTYAMTVAQTGRLSSNDPNLQNIPVRTELGRHIRTAFVASPGKRFVSADYSQFELRLAAVMADDKELIDLFNKGADIHTATAAQVYGRELEDVTKQQRRAAKVINFGILYGMSPHGLAVAADMNYEQATHFIERYKELRAPLFAYIDRIKALAQDQGYVETIFGRRRPMPDIKSSNFMVRSGAERAAINMPIQGTEADLMKKAMIDVDTRLRKDYPTAKMLLQIHDSILVECDDADGEPIEKLLKSTMEAVAPDLPVKLTVDVSTGKNWGEA
jgi:DNA polymerase-1